MLNFILLFSTNQNENLRGTILHSLKVVLNLIFSFHESLAEFVAQGMIIVRCTEEISA
jgi:hypothetical protein